MLFLVMMKVLNAQICVTDEQGVFRQFGVWILPHRPSLYADDLVLFVSPVASNLHQ
jgi:hypothetical protein